VEIDYSKRVPQIAELLDANPRLFDFPLRLEIERLLFRLVQQEARRRGATVYGFESHSRTNVEHVVGTDAKGAMLLAFELVIAFRRISRGNPYEVWDLGDIGARGRRDAVRSAARKLHKVWLWLKELESQEH
jgi:hypothetical protein